MSIKKIQAININEEKIDSLVKPVDFDNEQFEFTMLDNREEFYSMDKCGCCCEVSCSMGHYQGC